MRPETDARFTRKSQRDPEQTAERFERNRRRNTRGQRTREAARVEAMVQMTMISFESTPASRGA